MKHTIQLISFFCVLNLLTQTSFAGLSKNEAVIQGKISSTAECKKAPNQVWISAGRTLIYQAEIPENGSFEFHLVPGKYNVVVNNPKSCFIEKAIELKNQETKNISLNLTKIKKAS